MTKNKDNDNDNGIAEERAAKIDALANQIIDEARKRDAERRRRNEEQWQKFKLAIERGAK